MLKVLEIDKAGQIFSQPERLFKKSNYFTGVSNTRQMTTIRGEDGRYHDVMAPSIFKLRGMEIGCFYLIYEGPNPSFESYKLLANQVRVHLQIQRIVPEFEYLRSYFPNWTSTRYDMGFSYLEFNPNVDAQLIDSFFGEGNGLEELPDAEIEELETLCKRIKSFCRDFYTTDFIKAQLSHAVQKPVFEIKRKMYKSIFAKDGTR